MSIEELIKSINEINCNIEKLLIDNIGNEIKKAITRVVSDEKSQDIRIINSPDDLCGFQIVGFYMIFNNDIEGIKNNTCTCRIKYEKEEYTCVYRGHSYHMKDRLLSHLFYEPNGTYPNCMQVKINDGKYNINIEKKTLFNKDDSINIEKFPNWKWLVVKVPMPNSKQAIREMFEDAFDKIYAKPIYSVK